MFSAICFDFDNTLSDFSASELLAIETFLDPFNISDRQGGITTFLAHNSALWPERKKLGTKNVFDLTVERTLNDLGICWHKPSLGMDYLDVFSRSVVLFAEAEMILAALAQQAPLILISNGVQDIQRMRVSHSNLAQYFNTIAISGDYGIEKPDRRIFDYALRNVDAPNSHALHIGDSMRDDYIGAQNAGLQFCYANLKKRTHHHQVDLEITKLRQLYALTEGFAGVNQQIPTG